MNDQGEKLDPEALDESAAADAPGGDSASSENATPTQRIESPAEASLSEEKMLAAETEGDSMPVDESHPPDVLDTAASDDTVTEDAASPEAAAAVEDEEQVEETDEEEVGDEQSEEARPSPAPRTGPIELDVPEEEEIDLNWYILKVQSNRERSIADALRRKIAIEGLDSYFGQVLVPTEKVTEFKGGKKKIVERKLWPGYIAVEMHVNDDTWFAIRETSGIGDFTGSAGKPTPMEPSEIALILHTEEEEAEEAPKLDIKFTPGDKVKVMEGNFENFEGEVSSIDETHGRVTVMLSIFGRPTPVELEYWQVEGV